MKRGLWVAGCIGLILASPAFAGDQPLYAPAPEWVKPAALPDDKQPSGAGGVMLLDFQHRIDGPTVWQYSDTIRRLDSPESLTQSNIITLPWSPDKGDLIIHQLSILRERWPAVPRRDGGTDPSAPAVTRAAVGSAGLRDG